MSQYSSSTYPPQQSSSTGSSAPTSNGASYPPPNPYHAAPPIGVPPMAPSSYGSHRGPTSTHSTSNYRYHPYEQQQSSSTTHSAAPSNPYSTSYGHPQAPPQQTSNPYGSSSYSQHSHSTSDLRYYNRSSPPPSSGGRRDHQSSSSSYRPSSSSYSQSQSRYGHSRSEMNLHSLPKSRKGKAPRNEFGIPYGQPGAGLQAPDWHNISLPQFQKNFYREAPAVQSMSENDVLDWRKKYQMTVTGKNIPRPIRTFAEAGFPPYIMAEIERAGFKAPTAIQSQGWPMAMSGRDVIGIAETGSGKTLGFLLPCIVHINAQPLLRKGDGPIVLCIAPTRELAVQIEGEVSKFAYSSKIKHCCVYGGVSRRDQARTLGLGVEIVICTPGRLLDFLESKTTNLRRVTYLVIDEADRLLDMGFEPQLKAMLSQVRPDRQILMWSATWPAEVRELAKEFIREADAIQVSIGSFETKANHNVTQIIQVIQQYEKQDKLLNILREQTLNDPTGKILVFTATKRQCDYLYRTLKHDNFSVTVIHGDKQQYDRDNALNSFKSGKCMIMIATDVASRGIHVDNIRTVINYDFPGNIEDYVHRIGRTGRCGNTGNAISFFTRDDAKRTGKLINVLKEAKQHVPQKLIELSYLNNNNGGQNRQRYSRR